MGEYDNLDPNHKPCRLKTLTASLRDKTCIADLP